MLLLFYINSVKFHIVDLEQIQNIILLRMEGGSNILIIYIDVQILIPKGKNVRIMRILDVIIIFVTGASTFLRLSRAQGYRTKKGTEKAMLPNIMETAMTRFPRLEVQMLRSSLALPKTRSGQRFRKSV